MHNYLLKFNKIISFLGSADFFLFKVLQLYILYYRYVAKGERAVVDISIIDNSRLKFDHSNCFMTTEYYHSDHEAYILYVDSHLFYYYWLLSSIQAGLDHNWNHVLPIFLMPFDYKYNYADAAFSRSHLHPIPPAIVRFSRSGNIYSLSFIDGITRTFWLINNGIQTFPVVLFDINDYELLKECAGANKNS